MNNKISNKTFLLLGANLGDRRGALDRAFNLIEEKAGKILNASGYYETEAWGLKDQPVFLNRMLVIEPFYNAAFTLEKLLDIEKEMGRERENAVKWGSRIIDIDIIYFGDQIINTDSLKVPHPHLQERRFVLRPLADLDPEYIHPALSKTSLELLNECKDDCEVREIMF